MNEITIEMRESYGRQVFYPVCRDAKLFAALAGTKTLTKETLRQITQLGYKIITTQQSVDFNEGERHGPKRS
jgi:hypothetical protein